MAIRKRRKTSQREPIGDTKSSIIVHISEKEKATITDIREHLRSEKNIRNIKVIRKHLSDLVSEEIISVKKAESRGLSDIYYIEKSFSSFKTAFNFLNDFYKPLFLKSNYAKKLIFSDDFFYYGILNIIIEVLRDLIQLRDEKKFNEMIEKAKRNGEDVSSKEMIEVIKKLKSELGELNISNDSDFENFLSISKPEDLISFFSDLNENQLMDFKFILNTVIKSIFPDKQRNEMLLIILTSPMATDYFLNLRSVDRTYLFEIILWFYLKTLFIDRDKISIINKFNENQSELKNNPLSFISGLLNIQNVLNDNPLLTILRSFFIVDAFNGNIVDNKYSNLVLKKILLPKVSQ